MNRDYFISVAMATYNGEKFIKEQLDSILKQLDINDEIIISDDGSTDNTINIINSYNDKRIKLIDGPKLGVKQNFANAINNCNGKYIFLSDQDDIWLDNKVNIVLKAFNKYNATCIVHDAIVFNSNTNKIIINSFYDHRKSKKGIINNIIKNSYLGCCMAFDSNMKEKILPIPNNIEMHDQWIGLLNDKYGKSVFIEDILLKYRRHNDNVSSMKHYPLWKMIKNRISAYLATSKNPTKESEIINEDEV